MTIKTICTLCGEVCEGYGNNAWPINAGRCCDECDDTEVFPARLRDVAEYMRSLSA